MAGLLGDLLGAADPVAIPVDYTGERTTEVVEFIVAKFKQYEGDPFMDKRILSLLKLLFVMQLGHNPFRS